MYLTALGVSLLGALSPLRAEAGNSLDRVASFPRFPSDEVLQKWLGQPLSERPLSVGEKQMGGVAYTSEATGRLYQPYSLKGVVGGSPAQVGLLIRDPVTYDVVGGLRIPEIRNIPAWVPSNRGVLPAVTDVKRKRIFFWIEVSGRLLILDENTLTYRIIPMKFAAESPTAGGDPEISAGVLGFETQVFEGLSYSSKFNKLYAYFSRGTVNSIVEINPESGNAEWSRIVRACRAAPYENAVAKMGSVPILRVEDAVYLPCMGSSSAPVIVRLEYREITRPDGAEKTFVGQGRGAGYLIDEPGGRIHVRVESVLGPTIITFDVANNAWVGLQAVDKTVSAVNPTPWALDPATGRLYVQAVSPEFGLSILAGRGTPVLPGRQVPGFSVQDKTFAESPTMLAWEPRKGRLLVPSQDPAIDQKYLVLQDSPMDPDPPATDPDANTIDVDEQAGKTSASYAGEASGYGSRSLIVGGLRGYLPVTVQNWKPQPLCLTASREVALARVEKMRLNNSLIGGAAVAAEGDPSTKQDLKFPSRCLDPGTMNSPIVIPPALKEPIDDAYSQFSKQLRDLLYPVADTQGRDWPFQRAECTPANPKVNVKPNDPVLGGYEASVDCTASTVSGSAYATPFTFSMAPSSSTPVGVSVASASTITSVRKDPKRGLVTTVESVAKGIEILGVIQIESAYAKAETWANGRPGKAGTSYERRIVGVRTRGANGGYECKVCATEQQLADMALNLNRALGADGEVKIPTPDGVLAGGTPRGYQSAIQREKFESLSTKLMNGDGFLEVPALEVIRYADNTFYGRQRQIYQFAGVLANSQYGIFRLPDAGSFGALSSFASTDESGLPQLGGVIQGVGTSPLQQPPLIERIIKEIGRKLTEGLTFLLANPKTAGLLAVVWALLASPLMLAQRRRLLLNLSH